MSPARLEVTREQVVARRRHVGSLDERLPAGSSSLRIAAWAGLSDSMPRGALLSIHARVVGTGPTALDDPSLAQVWGPRFSAYVVAAEDAAFFTLGRWPGDAAGQRRAETMAARLHDHLAGRRMRYGEAGHALGVNPNALRYGTTTGRIRIQWDGARQPTVWTVPPPEISAMEARLELARRFLHVFGPSTPESFGRWAGIKRPGADAAFGHLAGELTPVATPIGNGWILASDEAALRDVVVDPPGERGVARLLPSGDTFFLLWGADRELLVPDARLRSRLWTSRVWPGAVLLGGEIVGTWRRAEADVDIEPWRHLALAERGAVEAEAESLPLPALARPIRVRWAD